MPRDDFNERASAFQSERASELDLREPDLDVGPPDAPDIHVVHRPSLLDGVAAQPLPVGTRLLLVALAIVAVLVAVPYMVP